MSWDDSWLEAAYEDRFHMEDDANANMDEGLDMEDDYYDGE